MKTVRLVNRSYIILCLHFIVFISISSIKTFAQAVNSPIKVELIKSELVFEKAPFKQCHASSLAELSDGKIMAVWFGGTHEGNNDVSIWGSIRNQNDWSEPKLIADGMINDSLRYPCWNPVLFKSRNGELYLFYKVGPSPSKWWGMFKKSLDDGQTWSAPMKLPDGILGPIKNKPIYTSNGRIISPSSIERSDIWHAHMEISDDDGITWTKVPVDTTTGYKLIQPTLLTLNDGSLLALMRSDQNYIVESRSSDNGATWSKPGKTTLKNPNSGIDAVTFSNGLHLLVYNPSGAGNEWFEGRSKLYLAISSDGKFWNDIYRLEDNISGEYSYPAIIQSGDGLVHITYTFNRVNIKYVIIRIKS